VLAITHRPAFLGFADIVYHLDGGRVRRQAGAALGAAAGMAV
jgi:hypothetical protein